MLRFAVGSWSLERRLLYAGALFVLGAAVWSLAPLPVAGAGLLLVLAGHVPLWVRTQTTAPGGATPEHEEMWAPVEEDWLERIRHLEAKGARWDASPFDFTNARGCGVLFGLAALIAGAAAVSSLAFGPDAAVRVMLGAGALLLPLWVNGIRTTWNPSELQKKGAALEAALHTAETEGSDFDPVPLLALREGPRGKYPVDAKLMLRPASERSGFLGVQVQVAMNSVQGTDYPYLYAVVLVEEGARLPAPARESDGASWGGRPLVYETGEGDGARFLVVRQHADTTGGWHTDEVAIHRIVIRALELGREAAEANRS